MTRYEVGASLQTSFRSRPLGRLAPYSKRRTKLCDGRERVGQIRKPLGFALDKRNDLIDSRPVYIGRTFEWIDVILIGHTPSPELLPKRWRQHETISGELYRSDFRSEESVPLVIELHIELGFVRVAFLRRHHEEQAMHCVVTKILGQLNEVRVVVFAEVDSRRPEHLAQQTGRGVTLDSWFVLLLQVSPPAADECYARGLAASSICLMTRRGIAESPSLTAHLVPSRK